MRNSPPVIRKSSVRPDMEASLKAGNKKESEIDEEWLQVDVNVKEKRDDSVLRIVLISDTHNKHEKLEMPEGDVLIHAGDFTNNGTEQEIKDFDSWLASLDYKHKIVVPGNHDTGTDEKALRRNNDNVEVTDVANAIVLRGEMVEVMGVRVLRLVGFWSKLRGGAEGESCWWNSLFWRRHRCLPLSSLDDRRRKSFRQTLRIPRAPRGCAQPDASQALGIRSCS